MAKQYPAWEYAFLKQLGATPNPQNLYFLSLWTQDEATPELLARHKNPLAMTDPYKNSAQWETGIWNYVGVVTFDTVEHGGTANAIHLQADDQNANGYQDIITALKGNSMLAMWKAVNKSNWCRGCDGGRYPGSPYRALGAGGVAPPVGTPLSGNGGSGDSSTGVPAQEVGSGKKKNIVTCADKGAALKIGPSFFGTSISQCNVKALTGGMITILGMQMMFLGVVVVGLGLGLKTKTGQTVKRTAVRAGKTAITKKLPFPKAANASQAARDVGAPPPPPAPPMAPRTAPRTVTAA